MKSLLEALISKTSIKKIVNNRKVFTDYKKKDLRSGDVVKLKDLRNEDDYFYGVIMLEKDGYFKKYYPSPEVLLNHDFIVEVDSDGNFSWLALDHFNDNLEPMRTTGYKVMGVMPGVFSDHDLKNPGLVAKWLLDKKSYENYFPQ